MDVSVLCFLLVVPWVGLLCEIVTCPGHTHLLFLFVQFKYGVTAISTKMSSVLTLFVRYYA